MIRTGLLLLVLSVSASVDKEAMLHLIEEIEGQHVHMGCSTCNESLSMHGSSCLGGIYQFERFFSSPDVWRDQAMAAVRTANTLSELLVATNGSRLNDTTLFFSLVQASVATDRRLFASAIVLDASCSTCSHLFVLGSFSNGDLMVSDYAYLGKKLVAMPSRLRPWFEQMEVRLVRSRWGQGSPVGVDELPLLDYEQGNWTFPYYDCHMLHSWVIAYAVPILRRGRPGEGAIVVTGMSVSYINLSLVDVNQCDRGGKPPDDWDSMFAGTHRCDANSTTCVPVRGHGLKSASYSCECLPGFHYPAEAFSAGFNGSEVEDAFQRYRSGEDDEYLHLRCRPCPAECAHCGENHTCVADLDAALRWGLLTCNGLCIAGCLLLAVFVPHHHEEREPSSALMTRLMLAGAVVSYSEMFGILFATSALRCLVTQWLRMLGFLLTYGVVILQTWRGMKARLIRPVPATTISDCVLVRRLFFFLFGGACYAAAWTVVVKPTQRSSGDHEGVTYVTCTVFWWNFIAMGLELAVLLLGAIVCVRARQVSIHFSEVKLVMSAILNHGVVITITIVVSIVFKHASVPAYIDASMSFVRLQLTLTVLLGLIFGYRVRGALRQTSPQIRRTVTRRSHAYHLDHLAVSAEMERAAIQHTGDPLIKEELERIYIKLRRSNLDNERLRNPHLETHK